VDRAQALAWFFHPLSPSFFCFSEHHTLYPLHVALTLLFYILTRRFCKSMRLPTATCAGCMIRPGSTVWLGTLGNWETRSSTNRRFADISPACSRPPLLILAWAKIVSVKTKGRREDDYLNDETHLQWPTAIFTHRCILISTTSIRAVVSILVLSQVLPVCDIAHRYFLDLNDSAFPGDKGEGGRVEMTFQIYLKNYI
jgi:hypothetical protein